MTPSRYTFLLPLALAAALLAGFSQNALASEDWWPFNKKDGAATPQIQVNQAPPARESKLTTSFSPVIKQVAPSVVTIKTSKTLKISKDRLSPFAADPFFRRFFGQPDDNTDNDEQAPGQAPAPAPREQGLGSGVIVSRDGYVLTNNHVVDGVDEILVDLPNSKDKEYKAKVIGTDPKTDIAVLKIEDKDLPAATLGNSDHLEVGDVVLAIGNPFGIGQTVTMGIVSALGRKISDHMPEEGGRRRDLYENFIQTDAAINRGNSGGALIDAEGRVIGINTAIISPSGGNLGIGFAIPINMARFVMEQLIKNGKVARGYLGVQIQPLDPDLAESFGLKSTSGALVSKVEPNTGASAAGLKKDDILVELNGKPVEDADALRLAVADLPPGATAKIKYVRDGKTLTAEIKLSERPDNPNEPAPKSSPGKKDETGSLMPGVEIQELTDAARQQLNAPADLKGVLVSRVDADSGAAEKGLHQGSVITEIGSSKVTSVSEALQALKATKSDVVRFYLWEQGNYRFLPVRKSDKK